MPVARPPTVLCIDDKPNALIIRKLLLQRAGYTVFAALNGETALQLFQANDFDVIVSDHLLSGESGADLARKMKLLKPSIPIVLLSGLMEAPDQREFADAFLVKGDDPSLLVERVASVLRLASQSSDHEEEAKSLRRHISHFGRGDHVCFAYDNRAQQMRAAIVWMQTGLKRGERCRYFADENTVAEICSQLEDAGVDVQRERERGALAFATSHDSYLQGGRFDPDEMIDLLHKDVADCASAGFSRYRASGEMTWALGPELGCDRLFDYESRLDAFFRKNSALGLCQYSRSRFSSSLLTQAASVHRLGLSKTNNTNRWNLRIRQNPFYADIFQDSERQHFQYCVQRDGSYEVLDLGVGKSLQETRKAVEAFLRSVGHTSN